MTLLPQAIRPSIDDDILFMITAAAICGGAGTEATLVWPEVSEVDASSVSRPTLPRHVTARPTGRSPQLSTCSASSLGQRPTAYDF